MKKLLLVLSVLALVLSSCATSEGATEPAMAPAGEIAGGWEGTLEAQNTKLRVVFRLSDSGGFMDSPDQGVKDIPVSDLKVRGASVTIEVDIAQGDFKGEFIGPDTLQGVWSQPGVRVDLRLERQ